MEQILIEVGTPEDKKILLSLLPKLNSRVVGRSIPQPKSNESPIESLKRIAARGGATSFGDASEWQRQTREDRPLASREE